MKLRDSLINFVGLYKTPDYKLNSSSIQYLSDAAAEENRLFASQNRSSLNIFIGNDVDYCGPMHSRTHSSMSAYTHVSHNPDYFSGRRQSEPAVHPNAFYRKISSSHSTGSRHQATSVISESDEESVHSRRGSETFFGSIAAYSNRLGPMNTRL